MSGLPIEAALPDLRTALIHANMAVLQAPPGAGKTTRVPLFLIEENLCQGRILMLEPRRLAARAAAERMAETLGEPVGQTVGYRMRGDHKSGRNTRIEVITEGILTRMIQSDPELSGVGCVIFDEFHERSLQADTGLAFTLEIRDALRDDLQLIVMSATLDAAPVAKLMGDAPVITSQGRSYPVDLRHLDRSIKPTRRKGTRLEDHAATLIERALTESDGGILVFLPGEGEIRRVESALRVPNGVNVQPLFGALPFAQQRRAILPDTTGRKIVLATSIAETSLTIQDIRVVVDCGLARRARFDAGSGMSRLITERVSQAEAKQRAGRAGRVAPGTCYKLWTKGEDGGLAPYPLPEILSADITGLILELAVWGTDDPASLPFLDPPRPSDVNQAQALLRDLGALNAQNRITDHGRVLSARPVHVRLAHMLEQGGPDAPQIAALLENRDPLPRTAPADLTLRINAIHNPQRFAAEHPFAPNTTTVKIIRTEAKRLRISEPADLSLAETTALAYPDRIGLRRKGDEARYILSGGKGAFFDETDPMGQQRLIVAPDLDGDAQNAKIRLAIPVSQAELTTVYSDQFKTIDVCHWSKRDRRVIARTQLQFGALVLEDRHWKDCPAEASNAAMTDGIRDLGLQVLPWSSAAQFFRARVEWLRAQGHEMPDMSDDNLLLHLETWLQPHLSGIRTPDGLRNLDLHSLLRNLLDWANTETLDQLAPASFKAPTGTNVPIDYSAHQPKIAVRLQEMFGLTTHPTAGPKRLPLLIELLSPARRAVQTTADLPGFWANSYADVRKDMRGRYPRHPWPDDPTKAEPTRRVKPRS